MIRLNLVHLFVYLHQSAVELRWLLLARRLQIPWWRSSFPEGTRGCWLRNGTFESQRREKQEQHIYWEIVLQFI